MKGILRIGTSGIVVPGKKQSFPEAFQSKSRLNYYSSLFNTLEVNSTFKKLPMVSTLEKWYADVPGDFQFTIKLWREITHGKQLAFDPQQIEIFFNTISHIGNKKGCLLIQFPGSITGSYISQVEQILLKLQQLDHENLWRKAIEFRSTTWYNAETFALLNQLSTALVLHDMPKSLYLNIEDSNPFLYFRFHGPKGDYRGSYTNEFLQAQAEKMKAFLGKGKDVYAYFNNTMGNAYENAMTLKAMME